MFERLSKISELFFINSDIKSDDFVIVFELEEDDLIFLEKDLYVRKNGNIKNFTKTDEVELTLNGIKFLIKKKF
jgi:hypothetical protein